MDFRKKTLKSGTTIFLGRDAKSNDELMRKFKRKENVVLHTAEPGSPFCVIEALNPSQEEVHESGIICARYSQDWRDRKGDVIVSVFTGKDVSKEKGMDAGTWKVKKSTLIKIKKGEIIKFEGEVNR